MKSLEIKKNIYWVGALDPDLRTFDIIMYTPYGTSYNSYVINGSEKVALFETVKVQFFDQYLERLKDLNIDITKIDYIVVNHTEPDHAGSVAKILDISPNSKVIGSPAAIKFLKKIANREFEYVTIKNNDTISLGDKTLQFISVPFLHWPDSIYTYVIEDEVLITCDSFGTHYSSEAVLNKNVENKSDYLGSLKYYFDCIFGPYKSFVLKALEKIDKLKISTILPGHGPVLSDNPQEIIELYREWSTPKVKNPKDSKLVTLSYVSAYGYTEIMAQEIARGIESVGNFKTKLYDIIDYEMSEIVSSIDESDGVLFGSPTIVAELLPPVRNLLTELNPIIHGGKLAAAFGSYGWSGEAIPRIETRLNELSMKLYTPSLKINFKPSDEEMKLSFDYGVGFAKTLLGEKNVNPLNIGICKTEEDLKEKAIKNNNLGDDSPPVIKKIKTDNELKLWKCLICGEIFESETVPEICIVCGAGSDAFIEVPRETNTFKSNINESFVVIGNGAAGFYATKAIRERNSLASITLISNELEHSYIRTQLSDLITEKPGINFYIEKESWYKENNINEILGVNVISANKDAKTITLDNGEIINYDKLILANGSFNFIPPTKVMINSNELLIDSTNYKEFNGIHTIKKLEDVKKIKECLPNAKNVVVIGGGLLGLEAASEFKNNGLNVTVIELADRILPRQLDMEGSKLLESITSNSGVSILLGESVNYISYNENGINSITLNSGKIIGFDLILYSVGIRPNLDLAMSLGLNINRAVVVDECMKTNIPDVFACGDVAEVSGNYYGNWPAAIEMGKVAGANSTGDNLKFEKFVSSVIFSELNAEVFSAGSIDFNDITLERIGSYDHTSNKYIKLFFKDTVLVGGVLIGDLKASAKIIEGIKDSYSKASMLAKGIL